jgi:Carboxypeptidase regulatory-like domain
MPRRPSALILLNALCSLAISFAPSARPQTAPDRFDIHGRVINAVTGEPISGALVQLADLFQFSQSDGTFTFTNLSSRQAAVFARKPGFFGDQELGRWNFQNTLPAEGDVTVMLTPEGIIFGQVKNEIGEPMEHVVVRALRWQVADGRRQLQTSRDAATDDEGNFRIAELIPGSYYLSFALQGTGPSIVSKLRRKTQAEDGYGLQFYPGVADITAAPRWKSAPARRFASCIRSAVNISLKFPASCAAPARITRLKSCLRLPREEASAEKPAWSRRLGNF